MALPEAEREAALPEAKASSVARPAVVLLNQARLVGQILEFLYSLEHLTSLQDHSDQMQEEEPDELPEAGASQESEEEQLLAE